MIGHLRLVIISHISIHAPLLRGAMRHHCRSPRQLAISIHAPIWGATGVRRTGCAATIRISIHAPI